MTLSHIWQLENIVHDKRGLAVEYDQRCTVCGKVDHVAPAPVEPCPGRPS